MASGVPDWVLAAVEVLTHPHLLIALGIGSSVLFVAGIVGVPWFIGRLPPDYFAELGEVSLDDSSGPTPVFALVVRIARNLLGVVLFLLGVLMLFLPGQGLLTMLVSLLLIDFPGKHRLIRRIIHYPPIFRSLNRIRHRSKKAPLKSPEPTKTLRSDGVSRD